MIVTFISQCEKKAIPRTRRVLDAFADRIGDNTWQTVITEECLISVKKLLRKTVTKSTAVSCHWIRGRRRSELLWIVGNRNRFNNIGVVPVNSTQKDVFMDVGVEFYSKGMNELYALDGMLYVNVFHRDGTGIGGSCGAGVKGDSYVYQFCLPTGKCPFNTTTSGVPNRVKLGAGILGAGLGQGRSSANNTGLIVNRPNTLNCTTTPNLPECQEFTTTAKLRQLRWYETR